MDRNGGRRAAIAVDIKRAKRGEDRQGDAELGERIRHLRKDILGLPRQEDFAERLGVTRGAVGNWEVGKGVKRANLERMAEQFNVSFVWLATGMGSPVRRQGLDSQVDEFPPGESEALYEMLQAVIDLWRKQLERKISSGGKMKKGR